eukprot:m.481050 g.481050  ORF g.481050 m.481050 type:complete len:79 (+) comp57180_c0_seq25:1454-1690(+)
MMHPSKQSSLSSTNCTFSSKSRFVISTTTTRGRSLTSARLPSRFDICVIVQVFGCRESCLVRTIVVEWASFETATIST